MENNMSYLVRMIEVGNWSDEDGNIYLPDNFNKVHSDGITKDLKSDDDTISLWEINDLSEFSEIAISLLTSKSSPQDLFIVAIPKSDLEQNFELENNNDAETAYKKYKSKHYDLLHMNYERLGTLSKIILTALQNDDNIHDFIYTHCKEDIKKLIDSGDIELEELKGKLKKDLI